MPIPEFSFVSLVPISCEGGGGVSDRTYTVVYRAEVNDQRYMPTTINHAAGLPAYGDFFQYTPEGETDPTSWDLMSVLLKKRSKLEDPATSKTRWLITLEYGPQQEGPTGAESGEIVSSPLDEKPRISGSFVEYLRAIDKDVDGDPIETTSKEPFDPPVEIEDGILEISVTKNYAAIDLTALANLRGKVNSDAIFGGAVEAGLARAKGFSFQQKWHANSPYYELTSTIQIKSEWVVRKLNQGFFEWIDTFETPAQYRILDTDKTPKQSPSLLDEDGLRLPRGGMTPPDPVYLPFTVYESASFAILDLPDLPEYEPPTPPGP